MINTDQVQYEHKDERNHLDGAIRWTSTVFDSWDVGLHYFKGTSRDPVIEARLIDDKATLIPVYYQMEQFGIDAQATLEAWLLKIELINRKTEPENFTATVAGFEYTMADFEDSDLGIRHHHGISS